MCVSTSGTIKQPRRAILLYRDRPPPSRRHCPPLPGKAPTALYPPTNALHCLHHLTTVELPAATAASFVLSGRRNMPTAATTETEQLEQQLLSGGQTHTALTVTRATGSPEGPSSRLTRTSAVTCPPAPVRAPVPTPPTAAAAASSSSSDLFRRRALHSESFGGVSLRFLRRSLLRHLHTLPPCSARQVKRAYFGGLH